jgi:hypothetical protein
VGTGPHLELNPSVFAEFRDLLDAVAKELADECMAKGYEIKVVPAKDHTVAKDLYLPNRKPK